MFAVRTIDPKIFVLDFRKIMSHTFTYVEIRKFPNVLGKMTDQATRLMDFPNPTLSMIHMKVYDKSDSRLLEIYANHDSDQFGALINFG